MATTYTVTAGEAYYPEMGGTHDGTALFRTTSPSGLLKWEPKRHDEALAALKRLRIRPRRMELCQTVRGGKLWFAHITWDACQKLRAEKLLVTEMLLD